MNAGIHEERPDGIISRDRDIVPARVEDRVLTDNERLIQDDRAVTTKRDMASLRDGGHEASLIADVDIAYGWNHHTNQEIGTHDASSPVGDPDEIIACLAHLNIRHHEGRVGRTG